jgi:periplasmic protein TonB
VTAVRLSVSLLAAVALHGIVFGVAAAVLSRQTIARPAAETVEVEVVAARPDPVAESAAVTEKTPLDRPTLPRPRTGMHPREVRIVSNPALAPSTEAFDAPMPTPSGPASTAGPAASPLRARTSEAPSGNAIVSASPRYRTNPTPDYPLPCKRRREEGIVLLNVVVQADGLPAAISLNRSSGHPLLDRSALDAVRRWTFEPGRAAGLPVSSRVVVPVRFSLEQP